MSKNMSPRSRRFDALDQAECERIERNRAKAPTTVLLAQILFDMIPEAHVWTKGDLETIAIEVDGWAQAGHEVVQDEVDAVARRVNILRGIFPLTCSEKVWGRGRCGRPNRPGGRECLDHTTIVQGVSR